MRSRHQSLWRKKCATILAPSLRDTKFCSETGAPHHPRPSPPCLDCGLEPIATKYCPETGRLHRAGPTHITSPIPKTHETNLRRVNHDSGDELPPHVRLREEGQHDEGRARNPPLTRRQVMSHQDARSTLALQSDGFGIFAPDNPALNRDSRAITNDEVGAAHARERPNDWKSPPSLTRPSVTSLYPNSSTTRQIRSGTFGSGTQHRHFHSIARGVGLSRATLEQ